MDARATRGGDRRACEFFAGLRAELIAHAEHAFWLAQPAEDGHPREAHYRRAAEITGLRPPELDGPECPECLRYVLDWFVELSRARGSNGFGPNPVGYGELAAWSALTGAGPTRWEVDLIMALDQAFLKSRSSASTAPPQAARQPGKGM